MSQRLIFPVFATRSTSAQPSATCLQKSSKFQRNLKQKEQSYTYGNRNSEVV